MDHMPGHGIICSYGTFNQFSEEEEEGMKKNLIRVFAVLMILSFSAVGSADVLDPFDNMSAPPGTFALLTYTGILHFPDIADNNGDEFDLGMDLSYFLLRPVYVAGKIADKMTWGFNAIFPVFHLSLDSDNVFGAPSVNEFGLGDVVISPFIYLYENTDSQFYISFWEFIYTPTGDYDEKNLVNIGKDAWYFQHQIAFGWYPGKFGVDACLNYWQYTESDEIDYREPDAFEAEAVVHYGLTEKFRVGAHIDYYQGLDDAEYDGVSAPDSEPMWFRLGMNFSYALQENLIAGVRWMHDVDAENYPTGDWVYFRLLYVF